MHLICAENVMKRGMGRMADKEIIQADTIRAKAIKEFSYELKIKIGFTRGLKNLWLLDLIDNLVKEMVGEQG